MCFRVFLIINFLGDEISTNEVGEDFMKDKKSPMTKEERREFLKRAGTASLSVPASALLLSVTKKRAHATGWGYGDSDSDSNEWDSDGDT
jgi:hypothetical protein